MKHENTGYAGAENATVGGYVKGFILSVLFTLIPFALVMFAALPAKATLICIVAFAIIQILVQLYYFMHMNTHSDEIWNLVSLVFTTLIIAIVVVGSLWIMYNLNVNMMPQ